MTDKQYLLNDALNKALISKDRIKGLPNSNKIEQFVTKYLNNLDSCDNCKFNHECRFILEAAKNGNICKFHIRFK